MYLPVNNPQFESAPSFTAATGANAVWIDGTAAGSASNSTWGWGIITGAWASPATAKFDTTVSHSGSNSLLLSTGGAAGAITVSNVQSVASLSGHAVNIKASTSYTIKAWVNTNNVATNSAFIDFRQYSSGGTNLVTTSSSKLSGTNGWTLLSITVTTNASAAFGVIFLRNNVTGNTSSAWFDDISITGPGGDMLLLF